VNYRHHYHAGNFADLVKHAALLGALVSLTREAGPLTVIDTHAGAGVYDLDADMAQRSGEAQAGVGRLMTDPDAPQAFAALKAAIGRANPNGRLRFYPGSPRLTAETLRPRDRLTAFELRPDDAAALRLALDPHRARVEIVQGDGFEGAPARAPAKGAVLVLIDPPFERGDDYARIPVAAERILARNPAATIMVWAPLKDLETFDRLLRGLETLGATETLVAEARLRPLSDPMRLNGCALIVTHPTPGLEADLRAACDWVIGAQGEAGGEARLWRL
jgi:23S rRNA (adenine2030-N6)-methyltransferase